MLTRRILLAAALIGAGLTSAHAQGWKDKYPELVLGAIPVENASTTTDRYSKLADYLTKELGVKVTLRIANDYAAVIEGQRAGNIQIAYYGPASFARATMTGVETEPLAIPRHNNDATGYYSVIYVRKDSPYKTVEDLKGKTLALVDPNSTSGNNAPRFFLDKQGITVDTFFGRTVFAGSHENAALAVAQGTADGCANAWNSENDNHLTRMAAKGLLRDANGKTLTKDDFRIVFKSDFLPEGPYAVLKALPADLKSAIKQALLDMPKKDKAGFDALSDGKDKELVSVTDKEYEPIVEMLKFNDRQRKS